jgi:hypothetical protein
LSFSSFCFTDDYVANNHILFFLMVTFSFLHFSFPIFEGIFVCELFCLYFSDSLERPNLFIS